MNNKIYEKIKEKSIKKYPISVPELAKLDEYSKSLYLKMLCVVILHKNEPQKEQLCYLTRVLCNLDNSRTLEDYLADAMDFSGDEVDQFCEVFSEGINKYYFVIDGLILINICPKNEDSFKILSSIIALLGINKKELKYLCTIAKAIVEQDSESLQKEITSPSCSIEKINFLAYIQDFYMGIIFNDDIECRYYSPKDWSVFEIDDTNFKNKIYIFENLKIKLKQHWNFEKRSKVVFKNCTFLPTQYNLVAKTVVDFKLLNCRFDDFIDGVGFLKDIKNIEIDRCIFNNCIYNHEEHNFEQSNNCESLFKIIESKNIVLTNNELLNCNVSVDYNDGTGIFINVSPILNRNNLKVENNYFYNCGCEYRFKDWHKGNRFLDHDWCWLPAMIRCIGEAEENNNTIIGEVDRLFPEKEEKY